MEMGKRRKRVSGAGDASMLGRRSLGLLIMFFEDESIRVRAGEVKTDWVPSTIEDRDGSTG